MHDLARDQFMMTLLWLLGIAIIISAVTLESSLSSPLKPQAQPVTKFCNSVSQALLSIAPFLHPIAL